MRKAIVFLLILAGLCVRGQSSFIESITIEQGLSQGFVPSITQDEDGFLWFATKNGLNRYDGYQFKVFRNDPLDSYSLNNDAIRLVKSLGKFLFVVTFAKKPMLFHRATHRFYPIDHMFPDNDGILQSLFALSDTSISIWHRNEGTSEIYTLRWSTKLDSIIKTQPSIPDINNYLRVDTFATPDDFLNYNVSPDKKKFWLLTRDKILIREIGTDETIEIPIDSSATTGCNQYSDFSYIIHDIGGNIRIICNDRYSVYDGHSWKTTTLPVTPQEFGFENPETHMLWLGGHEEVIGIDLSLQKPVSTPKFHINIDNPIKCGFVDKSGILWIGTDAHGIRKFNPRSGAFKNYLSGYSVYCKPVYNGKNHVLLPDVRKGGRYTKLLNIHTGQVLDFKSINLNPPFHNHITVTENGNFWWIYTVRNGKGPRLTKFNPDTQEKKSFYFPDNFPWETPELYYSKSGVIWAFGTKHLIRFDISTRHFTLIKVPIDIPSPINAIEPTPEGTIWIGTANGLIKAIPKSGGTFNFSMLKVEKGNRNSLPTNHIKSLLCDPANPNILWIGTNGKGLCRYDIQNDRFSFPDNTGETLLDDVVYGILADDAKPRNLWLSSNRGLVRYNPESGFLQHFTYANGLQDSEFNTYASFKSSDGRLFFGGVNGLTVFNPNELNEHKKIPKLKFTQLVINGKKTGPRDSANVINKDVAYSQEIKLPHDKNNLVFEFAIMDFTSPEWNSFSYYLEGAEEPWAHDGFEHSAQYLNLSPGNYTFWVQGASSSGIHTAEPISMHIHILAPWYLTWPALVIYGLLFILVGFLFNQYQLLQRLKSAEAKRLRNLDEFKTRFYTNITHEFRTPLTVILGITDQLIRKSKYDVHPHKLIRRNAENLLRLINQILDLTKLESHDLKINYVQGDVLAFLKYISESLHSLANAQNVMLKVESNQATILMDYDPERLMQIIHNLLSNAIKFTPSGGQVRMEARMEGRNLKIEVTDTGIGIPEAEQPYLFDRFFQAGAPKNEDSKKFMEKAANTGGSGIGLSLTKELVQMMGGTIAVVSPLPGRKNGSRFTVTLPVNNKASMESETNRIGEQSVKLPIPDNETIPETEIKILLIEDNPDVMEYLAACLGERYHLEFAYNGRVGIETALEIIPDLIISDVMMPEKDGLEVCDFLKNDQRTSHIPVILLTAKVTLEARLAGLRRGADVYLDKPFHEEELLVWIDQLVARQQRLKQRYANLAIRPTEAPPESEPEALEMEDSFVLKFKNILENNYSNPEFSVDDITKNIGMSRSQLYRKLKSLTGKSVTTHLNSLRLEKSCEILKQGRLKVSEVAYQVGYNDPKYYSRLFSETYGKAPGEFAEEQKDS